MTAPAKAAPVRENVTQADRARVILAISKIERDVRVSELTDDEIGTLILASRHRLAHTARPDAGDEDVERVALAVGAVITGNTVDPFADPEKFEFYCEIARVALAAMREEVDRGMVDAATALFPEGTMYRSGHDGTGPDPSRFFCEAISDAPECRRVRVVADTEAEARSQAAAALSPEHPR